MKPDFRWPDPIALVPWLVRWLVLACAVAVLAGTAAALFMTALDWATTLREGHRWLLLGLPLAGFGVGWLYLRYGRELESGNNLLIDEIHDPHRVIPLRLVPLVLGSTVISHLFGASVGREGAAVQMGGALADQLTRLFRLPHEDRRILLMTGMSAGFAALFGTPLSAAIFGLEVLAVGRMRYDAILPCLIAAIVGAEVSAYWGVHEAHAVLSVVPPVTAWTLAAIVLAGAIFGLVGKLFAGMTHSVARFMARRVRYAPLRPMLGGVLVAAAVLALGADRYIGLGLPVMEQAFHEPLGLLDPIAKMLFTALSMGTGFKGGEVAPLLFIGATLGNVLAPLLDMPIPFLAAVGFVAVFAGAANTPIAATLLAIELFGAPIGVLAGVACVVSYLFSGYTSIYRSQRVGQAKHRPTPEGIRLDEIRAYRKHGQRPGDTAPTGSAAPGGTAPASPPPPPFH